MVDNPFLLLWFYSHHSSVSAFWRPSELCILSHILFLEPCRIILLKLALHDEINFVTLRTFLVNYLISVNELLAPRIIKLIEIVLRPL